MHLNLELIRSGFYWYLKRRGRRSCLFLGVVSAVIFCDRAHWGQNILS